MKYLSQIYNYILLLTNKGNVLLFAPASVQRKLRLERGVELLLDLAGRGQRVVKLGVDGVVRTTFHWNACSRKKKTTT